MIKWRDTTLKGRSIMRHRMRKILCIRTTSGTADAAHFRDNWDNRRAPVQNFSKEQTLESMEKLAGVAAANKAQIWINHDPAQTATLPKAPAFIQ
jgi:hypothetical protein